MADLYWKNNFLFSMLAVEACVCRKLPRRNASVVLTPEANSVEARVEKRQMSESNIIRPMMGSFMKKRSLFTMPSSVFL